MSLMGELKNSAMDAFGAIAQGFGDMVYGFLMGEKLSAKAFMAMAKGAIASVAAQAAVHALFELAMGFASLWLNPAKAGAHFLAAKTFGLVAAMAGAVSLAIPGGGAATGNAPVAGNASRSVGGTAEKKPIPIDANRTAGEQRIVLEVRSNDSHIIDVATRNIQQNGKLRLVLGNETLATT